VRSVSLRLFFRLDERIQLLVIRRHVTSYSSLARLEDMRH